jgi:hypothetical protein
VIGFFYHRLSVCRIDAESTCRTDEEAVTLAAALDTVSRPGMGACGTYPFRYFGP